MASSGLLEVWIASIFFLLYSYSRTRLSMGIRRLAVGLGAVTSLWSFSSFSGVLALFANTNIADRTDSSLMFLMMAVICLRRVFAVLVDISNHLKESMIKRMNRVVGITIRTENTIFIMSNMFILHFPVLDGREIIIKWPWLFTPISEGPSLLFDS